MTQANPRTTEPSQVGSAFLQLSCKYQVDTKGVHDCYKHTREKNDFSGFDQSQIKYLTKLDDANNNNFRNYNHVNLTLPINA